jgi:regulator of RNase E activity RraA
VTLRNIPERKAAARGHVDKDATKIALNDVFLLSEPGDVLVCDFGGNGNVSNLGGTACMVAQALGVIGALVYGGVRDVAEMQEIDFPVWSSGVSPTTGRMRLEAIEVNGPVTVHGIVVHPGDLVLADEDGIVFVPPQQIEAVLKGAEAEEASAKRLRDQLLAKPSVAEVRAMLGPKRPTNP